MDQEVYHRTTSIKFLQKQTKEKILLSVGHHLFGEIFRRRLKMLVVQIPSKIYTTAGNLSQNIEAFIWKATSYQK